MTSFILGSAADCLTVLGFGGASVRLVIYTVGRCATNRPAVLLMYRSPELMYKYGNYSEGVCKPGYAAAKMTAIYPK